MPRNSTSTKQSNANNSKKPSSIQTSRQKSASPTVHGKTQRSFALTSTPTFFKPLDRDDIGQKSYEHFKKTGQATLMPPNYKKSQQTLLVSSSSSTFSRSSPIAIEQKTPNYFFQNNLKDLRSLTNRQNFQQTFSNISSKLVFKSINPNEFRNQSPKHIREIDLTSLAPTFDFKKFKQPLSECTSVLPDVAKTLGKKVLIKELSYVSKELGAHVGRNITFLDGVLSFGTAHKESLQNGNSPTAALVCSTANVVSKQAVKAGGYMALTTGSSGLTATTGLVGFATSVAFWSTGAVLIEKSSATVGDLVQKACHAAFKWREQSNSSSLPQYRHY